MNPFMKARLALTGWYIVLLIILLSASSVVAIQSEKYAFNRIEQALGNKALRPQLTKLLETRFDAFESNFITRLVIFNIILLIAGSVGCYYLSGYTLTPIDEMLKEQEKFAADASHQLRTPLTNMNIEIDTLLKVNKTIAPDVKQSLTAVKGEIERMTYLVTGMLTLIRNRVISTQQGWQTTKIATLLTNCENKVQQSAKTKRITIKHSFSTKPLTIYCNPSQLTEAFITILDNAVKYSPQGSVIEIKSTKEGSHVAAHILDAGPGVENDDLPHIFDRFYRGTNTKNSVAGTGLGLSIARDIITAHRGHITIHNRPQKGLDVAIILPESARENHSGILPSHFLGSS